MGSSEIMRDDSISENPSSEIDTLLKNIKDTNDLYFISLVILGKLVDSTKYSMLSELSYLLDSQSFLNLLFYFEGMTIRIPTRQELKTCLTLISLYYNYDVLKYNWKESLSNVGIKKEDSHEYWKQYKKFRKELENVKFPREMRMPRMDDKLKIEGIDP